MGGVREYITLPDNPDQNDASDITAHVPRYVRGNVSRSPNVRRTRTCCWSCPKRCGPACGSTNTFGTAAKNPECVEPMGHVREVLSAAILNTGVYLIMQYGDGVHSEAMDITPGYKDEGETFEYCLDRKITERDVTPGPTTPSTRRRRSPSLRHPGGIHARGRHTDRRAGRSPQPPNEMNRYVSLDSSFYSTLGTSSDPTSASTNNRASLRQGYGIASTQLIKEPAIELELSAGIRPKIVNKADLNLFLKLQIFLHYRIL